MRKRRHAIAALVLAPLIATAAASCLGRSVAPKSSVQQCPTECGLKDEHRPWVYSGTQPVIALCIKAGQGHFAFAQDGTDGCYTVSGLGTTTVMVTGGGTSRSCQDISNVVFYFDCGGPPG